MPCGKWPSVGGKQRRRDMSGKQSKDTGFWLRQHADPSIGHIAYIVAIVGVASCVAVAILERNYDWRKDPSRVAARNNAHSFWCCPSDEHQRH